MLKCSYRVSSFLITWSTVFSSFSGEICIGPKTRHSCHGSLFRKVPDVRRRLLPHRNTLLDLATMERRKVSLQNEEFSLSFRQIKTELLHTHYETKIQYRRFPGHLGMASKKKFLTFQSLYGLRTRFVDHLSSKSSRNMPLFSWSKRFELSSLRLLFLITFLTSFSLLAFR